MASELGAANNTEQERLEIERRRLALESSFPRKWGPVLFGSLATLAVAIVSGAVSWTTSYSQSQLTERENVRQAHDHQIANARTALEMYFTNVDSLAPENPRALYNMRMIAEISDNEGVRSVFNEMRDEIILKKSQENPDKAISDIAAELPAISGGGVSSSAAASYPDFTVYIQYAKPAGEAGALKVRDALATLGVRTPGMEGIDPAKVPAESQIRFYSTNQKEKLEALASELQQNTGIVFKSVVLPRSGLPQNIFEVWIGKNES